MVDKTERSELTPRQEEVYLFLVKYIKEHLYAPSYQEIVDNTKVSSKSDVRRILNILKNKSYIKTEENKPRMITLIGYKLINMAKGE